MKTGTVRGDAATHHGLLWYCIESFKHRHQPKGTEGEVEASSDSECEGPLCFFQNSDELDVYVRSLEEEHC